MTQTLIPKIIHYVWVGPNEPKLLYLEQWKRLLPSYEFMYWHEGNIDFSSRFIRTAYAARAYNRVANYARVSALHAHGGIYMDHDVELLKSWDAFLEQKCFVGFETDRKTVEDIINNALIGSVPGHPFLARVLAALDSMDGGLDVGSGSGPGLLSRLFREGGAIEPSDEPVYRYDVVVYPKRFFYPYEYGEQFTPDCIKDDTVAIHHWDYTWNPKGGRLKRFVKKMHRVVARVAPEAGFHIARWRNMRSRNETFVGR